MKIVRMKIGFWLIPQFYCNDKCKVMFLLWWKFIFKWTNSA